MANNIELSILMGDAALDKGKRGGEFIEALGYTKLNIEGGDTDSGLQTQAYINKTTREIVVSIAGTGLNLGDMIADLDLISPVTYHQQFYDGIEFANRVDNFISNIEKYSKYKVSFTGFSLGGAHAQLISHTYGWEGFSFDAPRAGLKINTQGYLDQLENHMFAE